MNKSKYLKIKSVYLTKKNFCDGSIKSKIPFIYVKSPSTKVRLFFLFIIENESVLRLGQRTKMKIPVLRWAGEECSSRYEINYLLGLCLLGHNSVFSNRQESLPGP